MPSVPTTRGVTLYSLFLPRMKLEDLWAARKRKDLFNMESPLGNWTIPNHQSLDLTKFLDFFLGARMQWLPNESGCRLIFLESSAVPETTFQVWFYNWFLKLCNNPSESWINTTAGWVQAVIVTQEQRGPIATVCQSNWVVPVWAMAACDSTCKAPTSPQLPQILKSRN